MANQELLQTPPPLNFTQTQQVIKHFTLVGASDEQSNELFAFIYQNNLSKVLECKELQEIITFVMGHLNNPRKPCLGITEDMKDLIKEILSQDYLYNVDENASLNLNRQITPTETSLAVPIFAGEGSQIGTGVLLSTPKGHVILTCAHIVLFVKRQALTPYIIKNGNKHFLYDGRFPRGYLDPRMEKRTTYNYGIMFVQNLLNENELSLKNIIVGNDKHTVTSCLMHTNFKNTPGQTYCNIISHLVKDSIIYFHNIVCEHTMSGSPLVCQNGEPYTIYGLGVGGFGRELNRICLIDANNISELVEISRKAWKMMALPLIEHQP